MSGTTTASGLQQVTNYVVYHEVGATTEITIYLQSGVGHSVRPLRLDEAQYMLDILRNEKPLFYDPAKRALRTSYEPPGEAE
jgi:hypothetical protein